MKRHYRMGTLAALAVIALAGCSGTQNAQQPPTGSSVEHSTAAQPIKTSDVEWKTVADALGRPGQLASGGTVYRVSFPRRDLSVTSRNVQIKPGLALGSYASFARYGDGGTIAMGDLVVTEDELPKVTDALQQHGIAQTALHKHLLEQTPPVWWTHFHAEGHDPATIARGLRAALDATATPAATPATAPTPLDLDTGAVDTALRAKGTNDGGIYKFSFARRDPVRDHGKALPPAMGVNTALNFQPTGGGKAAINGDFALTTDEVQKVIQALRTGGIEIVELHNHALDDDPHLFYMHFWANDNATKLAQTLRKAIDAQNVTPAS